MPDSSADLNDRILEQLLGLREAGALAWQPLDDVDGVHRYTFRCGGWPIEVVLDTTVLELRVYHQRHLIATGAVRAQIANALHADGTGSGNADEHLAALRAIVNEWKSRNARLFMEPPRTARHPDGWVNA